ncbi:uncharacterized protein LOC119293586 [Triticum dicoccoides]|uniref:uncharacterized protein LOC119293586 n=1 Tax=Triticum dicoccoides TaxID=85692 RepID=UPI00188E7924|nr:uncharacterized protein LOC119293586 [Triticum dicoccoides]
MEETPPPFHLTTTSVTRSRTHPPIHFRRRPAGEAPPSTPETASASSVAGGHARACELFSQSHGDTWPSFYSRRYNVATIARGVASRIVRIVSAENFIKRTRSYMMSE